jgi:hypothetical protein
MKWRTNLVRKNFRSRGFTARGSARERSLPVRRPCVTPRGPASLPLTRLTRARSQTLRSRHRPPPPIGIRPLSSPSTSAPRRHTTTSLAPSPTRSRHLVLYELRGRRHRNLPEQTSPEQPQRRRTEGATRGSHA